jgi:hypothetical protein
VISQGPDTADYTATGYGYDAIGDVTSQGEGYYEPNGTCLTSYQDETATYDALGRVTSICPFFNSPCAVKLARSLMGR